MIIFTLQPPQMVASEINETNEMSGSKSLFVQLDFLQVIQDYHLF